MFPTLRTSRFNLTRDLLMKLPHEGIDGEQFTHMVDDIWERFQSGDLKNNGQGTVDILKAEIAKEQKRLGVTATAKQPVAPSQTITKKSEPVVKEPVLISPITPKEDIKKPVIKPGVLLRHAGRHQGVSLEDALAIANAVISENHVWDDTVRICRERVNTKRLEVQQKRQGWNPGTSVVEGESWIGDKAKVEEAPSIMKSSVHDKPEVILEEPLIKKHEVKLDAGDVADEPEEKPWYANFTPKWRTLVKACEDEYLKLRLEGMEREQASVQACKPIADALDNLLEDRKKHNDEKTLARLKHIQDRQMARLAKITSNTMDKLGLEPDSLMRNVLTDAYTGLKTGRYPDERTALTTAFATYLTPIEEGPEQIPEVGHRTAAE